MGIIALVHVSGGKRRADLQIIESPDIATLTFAVPEHYQTYNQGFTVETFQQGQKQGVDGDDAVFVGLSI